MATLAINNEYRAPRNNNPVEFDAKTQIGLTGFRIGSPRKCDTIYRQQNIRSPEKKRFDKNIISSENFSFFLFHFEKKTFLLS